MRSIPLHTTLNTERNSSQNSTHNYHRMKTDQTAFEKVFHSEILPPTVIIRITNNKTRKNKKEIHSKIPVVESLDITGTSKSKAFKYMIPYYHKSSDSSQSIKKIIMRLCICKCCRRDFFHNKLIDLIINSF